MGTGPAGHVQCFTSYHVGVDHMERYMQPTEFVYVGDAMCSWCWGFAPTITALRERFTIPVRLVNGGLRPGPNAEKLDDRMRDTLLHHWHQVEQASGQPFDTSFLARTDGWIYDTELPAMAVVTAREMAPELALDVYERLQRAFYAETTDITDPGEYQALIEPFAIDTDAFLGAFGSETARWKAWEDFEEARGLGITGFPALLLRTDGDLALVTRGWAPIERLAPAIEAYLRDQLGSAAEGLVCEIDDPNC